MIIAGIGFSSKALSKELLKAIQLAFDEQNIALKELALIATGDHKRDSAALQVCAKELDVAIEFIAQADLEAMEPLVFTRSQKSLERTGVPCLSEAAALAAALTTDRGKIGLLANRIICGPVTCALVQVREQEKEKV